MAGSSPSLGLQFHVRSISLPSRLHPLSTKLELELNKLKTWQTSVLARAPLIAETIQTGLVGLAELYNCVEELIHSPLTQQALLQHQQGMLLEEAIEGSVGLLDSCGTVRDLVSMMKEHVQDLQSALRRKGGESRIESDISKYISFRKKVIKRDIPESLRALKIIENKVGSSLLDEDQVLKMVMKMLREVSAITISVFRSLLMFLSVPTSKTRLRGWSLISKLMVNIKSSDSEPNLQKMNSEVETVDLALHYLHGNICRSEAKVDVQMVRRRLQTLDDNIQGFEAGLDCLYRRLIQSRVSLLNILAQ
ncbi:unnamed protein product [Ilex paraguariensis]|uniref:Uncharacterized protein n=1 Tax=Ilex paraguariensis TaxID=185542 RepID=A0ABC8RX53_9AQUA